MHSDYSVMMLMSVINETLEANEQDCMAIKAQYDEHSYLWLTNMEEFFEEFKAKNMIETANGLKILDLAKYEAELSKYEGIRESILQFNYPVDIGWLRINTQPIKSELIKWASRWIDLFTNHLKETLTSRLTGLHEFMGVASKGLEIEVPEGPEGQAQLMQVMENIRDVRMASEETKDMFEPLQKILVALKSHGVDITALDKIGEDNMPIQDYLDEAPLLWDNVEKKMFRKK